MPIICRKIAPDSIVYTDSYHSYNALDVGEFYHHRINHSVCFSDGKTNPINGIPRRYFPLFLKECEFRFNYGTPKQQLAILKKWFY